MATEEMILNHYNKFFGDYAGSDIYHSSGQQIQILGFPKVFKDCLVFATFGLSKYSAEIQKQCEVVLSVDDYFDACAKILANAVFYIISNKMVFGRGILIGGADSIILGFSEYC